MQSSKKHLAHQRILLMREFWIAFLVFSISIAGTVFLWMTSFGSSSSRDTDGLSFTILTCGILFDIFLFVLLYGLAFSRNHALKEIEAVEQDLAASRRQITQLYVEQEKTIDHAKDDFVSLASHQLRTPLSTINWYTEMLLNGDAGKLTKIQKDHVGHIEASSKRMVDLVNSLLNVSRIELGTFLIEQEKIDLRTFLESLLEDFKPTIQKKNLTIERDYPRERVMVETDPKILSIILDNVLSNACNYTQTDGSIRIALEQDRQTICLSITDTGCGIPKNQQTKIFRKLFRGDNVLKMNTTGSGLGLHISKALITQLGGDMWFTSPAFPHTTPPCGTKFTISLPRKTLTRKGIAL